jgi:hypothetical protein
LSKGEDSLSSARKRQHRAPSKPHGGIAKASAQCHGSEAVLKALDYIKNVSLPRLKDWD